MLPSQLPIIDIVKTIKICLEIILVDFKLEILLKINQLVIPLKEFKRIKIEDTAAVVLTGIQFNKIDKGVRKMPPPVPVIPDAKPRMDPVIPIFIKFGIFGFLELFLFWKNFPNKNLIPERNKIKDKNNLSILDGIFK